jgi:hypothetical protein
MSRFPNMIGGDACSDLQVMQSAAGYYIGRSYLDVECGNSEFPYSRESGYYASEGECGHALNSRNFEVRDCVENNSSYDKGELPDIRNVVQDFTISVANKRTNPDGEYIGRPSVLGNPFAIGRDGTRDEVIAKYRTWLWPLLDEHNPSPALTEINRLTDLYDAGDLTLVCWCAPQACHGDVLAQAIPWWSIARS